MMFDNGDKKQIDLILKNYFTHKDFKGFKYSYENRKFSWSLGEEVKNYKINGLFVNDTQKDYIQLKKLTGSHKEYGAIASFSIEMVIKTGLIAREILRSKFSFIEDMYIFRLYSSNLVKNSFFRNGGTVSFYQNKAVTLENQVYKFIENIEKFFIKPEIMIYTVDNELLEFIDNNYESFKYPFFTKAIVYSHNNENLTEEDLMSLGIKRFSDYKHRKIICDYILNKNTTVANMV